MAQPQAAFARRPGRLPGSKPVEMGDFINSICSNVEMFYDDLYNFYFCLSGFHDDTVLLFNNQ